MSYKRVPKELQKKRGPNKLKSYDEIAAELGLHRNTVVGLVQRALAKLARAGLSLSDIAYFQLDAEKDLLQCASLECQTEYVKLFAESEYTPQGRNAVRNSTTGRFQ